MDRVGSTAIDLSPWFHPLRELQAKAALILGKFAEAGNQYRWLISNAPPSAGAAAAMGLALSKKFTEATDPDRSLVDDLAGRVTAGPMLASVEFARAKMSDDLQDYTGAARYLRKANAHAAQTSLWNYQRWHAFHARARRSRFPVRQRIGANEPTVVFVVGLPRSGTTLLSERLTRDRAIVTRGELNFVQYFHEQLDGAAEGELTDLIERSAFDYLTHLIRDTERASIYIDKNPMNFLFIDWIVAAFPNSKIVACNRHPADLALSLWFQYFESPLTSFSHDFNAIAAVMRSFNDITRFWSKRTQILHVNYEDLVENEDREIARVLSYIGFTQTGNHSPKKSVPTSIATSSLWQARQPIYAGSIGRYHRYLDYIPELGEFL